MEAEFVLDADEVREFSCVSVWVIEGEKDFVSSSLMEVDDVLEDVRDGLADLD